MSFTQTLQKIREAQGQDFEGTELLEAEIFARFMGQPYYEEFKRVLQQAALIEGRGLTDGTALIRSQGAREAYLDILDYLGRKERLARERLGSDETD